MHYNNVREQRENAMTPIQSLSLPEKSKRQLLFFELQIKPGTLVQTT